MTDWGYRAAGWLARRLPLALTDALAASVADLYVLTHPRTARAVTRRLASLPRAAAPAANAAEPERPGAGARETYRAFARAVRDFLRAERRAADAPRISIDERTRSILDRARAEGMPTLVVSGHFGPWELALGWLAREVGPLGALAAPHRSAAVERFFRGRRAAAGIRTLTAGSAASSALATLRAGGWIAALADRACAPRRRVDGLEGSVPIDRAPLLLARRAGARVLAGVSWRGADGALHVRFLEPFTLGPRRDGLSLAQGAARLQRFFDDHVRAHPTQWFDWAAAGPGRRGETDG
ncbi:MAG TPA: lysophospholipid acyltransferase family protein [Acidobacteriota bacterium]|nr:lysophospholipid acyltransferase family protein [Acidobacteriota bacterium]